MEDIPDTSFQDKAELDPFSVNAKSSVKIKKTTRGITWDIKVVTGEKDLLDDLMKAAIVAHKELDTQLNLQGGKK